MQKTWIIWQTPDTHLRGAGCPTCNASKGELKIRQILEDNSVDFETQKKFDGCVDKRPLKFDFYLPMHNLCVEYDGILHYKAVEYFGGQEHLEEAQMKDNIKNDFCKENGIRLLRIPYTFKLDLIEELFRRLRIIK